MIDIAFVIVTLSAAIWVGAIVFQTAVVAPSVFQTLEADTAGRLLRGLFPRFFTAGLVCGAGMIIGFGLLFASGVRDPRVLALTAAAVVMLGLQLAASRMVPAINAARDAGEAGRRRFGRLHGINVALTVFVLVLGIAILATLATAVPIVPGTV